MKTLRQPRWFAVAGMALLAGGGFAAAAARFDELGITRLPMFNGPDDPAGIWLNGGLGSPW